MFVKIKGVSINVDSFKNGISKTKFFKNHGKIATEEIWEELQQYLPKKGGKKSKESEEI